jgi:two-component system chemotaxis response regulator CheY
MAKSVLIVDDNEIIRRNLRRLFKKNENWIVCAEAVNGRDALEAAEKFHPDFVVLDFSMPVMDGLEAAPKLKDISPKAPIVMLTAFKDKYLEERAYKVGVSWVLSKTDDLTKVFEFARILLRPDPPAATSGASC